jgi:hypothetical protein
MVISNSKTDIFSAFGSYWGVPRYLVIHSPKNSSAATFAKQYEILFKELVD